MSRKKRYPELEPPSIPTLHIHGIGRLSTEKFYKAVENVLKHKCRLIK
ncbi:MAG: hypothetical protein AAB787_02425 [Patescibacteria group bacterium]